MNGASPAQRNQSRNASGSGPAFKVPLLDRILDAEPSKQRRTVLDLGGPSQVLLNRLLSAGPCRVEIADLIGSAALNALIAADTLESDADDLPGIPPLLPEGGDPLDLILCWDLPNYMSLSAFGRLCAEFAARAAPGCRLHMLVTYAQPEMPASPGRYSLRGDRQLERHETDNAMVKAPRYSPEDLGTAVGDFRYERGVLLANGMQEFVYVWPGPSGTGRQAFSDFNR